MPQAVTELTVLTAGYFLVLTKDCRAGVNEEHQVPDRHAAHRLRTNRPSANRRQPNHPQSN